ncbi:MAG: ABC transporter ATP-binding protein [Clostridia bacterium]|nr:ABC transporter ATP-binding protein [Clostridia bacterium]
MARPVTEGSPGAGLAVEGLTKRFGRVTAVDGLSLSARRGEVLGLLGPNGAGKTTTLLCLAGLARPDAGRVMLDGVELGSDRSRLIALIPEQPDVYPMLTVWEHMVFVAKACRLPEGWHIEADRLLRRFGLAERRDDLGEALSKGLRQKTLVAATVLAGAPVLLLDEPMIGLDPRGQRELRLVLRELCEEGRAVVVSTHLLEQAEAMCDRVVILKSGQKLAEGRPDELREALHRGASLEDVFLELTEAPDDVRPS